MAALIQSYEQQYSVLTADLTAKIGRLKAGSEDRDKLTKEIQGNFDEANDLLEQLELESRSAGGATRVAAYRAELQRVRAEYRAAAAAGDAAFNESDEVYDDWSGAGEQRRQLLDNSERLERTGKAMAEGYRVAIETEQIGAAVLQDLSSQRETIQRSRGRLRETDEQLNYSRRILNSMQARNMRQRLAVAGALATVLFVATGAIYLSFS